MADLDPPLVFIINFGGKRGSITNADLDAFATICDAQWAYLGANFTCENPRADQVRHALKKFFQDILQYAETGIPPG
ncbi:MAG: hypothetical protein IPM39_24930 [Chloroflexi bacterium]|nr:hypothetical protein [Chloroflexota bacterium]